ncbi:MAG: hypothetical protein ACYCST_16470 [Acidimicrobiales bacterium]
MTWGELVEARYLREYRGSLGVTMQRLRAFIEHLRDELGVPHPLAHARPWVGPGRHLFISAQEQAGLPPELSRRRVARLCLQEGARRRGRRGARGPAVTLLVVTACYGVVYVIDRRENWFDLSGHVVLAHVPGRRRSGWLAWCGAVVLARIHRKIGCLGA